MLVYTVFLDVTIMFCWIWLRFQVALWYSRATNTDDLAATIEADFGVKAKAYKCSVEDFEEVQKQTAAVVNDFGQLDVMIANAGISRPAGIYSSHPFLLFS